MAKGTDSTLKRGNYFVPVVKRIECAPFAAVARPGAKSLFIAS
ncbi:hypothetical protein B4168_3103 [Anoxybacillus flavithermus]|nr:hypothetical protein B4168_3103 [Anoxybacillus flavithermus]OAO86390.1 hypothetical protein GT23_2283 [Parageobacillus thermoglucosidasius]